MTDVSKKIQAFLFSEGGSIRNARLAQLAGISDSELLEALTELSSALEGSGLSLIRTETESSLVIAADAAESVKAAQYSELSAEIGDAGLEVLAVVLYRGASSRAEIDYIRGVNTSTTIRNLLMRGLVERTGNPLDGREYLYRPTTELLAHLGVSDVQKLPDYAIISSELASFEKKNSIEHTQ